MKERDDLAAKFDGIDPAVARATAAKLAALEQAKPEERIAHLESQLADANKRANGALIRDALDSAFLKAGGHPNAVDFACTKAADKFTVENGAVVGTVFDPNQPGVKLTVDAFINQLLSEAAYVFALSSGGNASPRKSSGENRSGVKEPRNPTPHHLGEAGADIKAGKIRVVYD
jgi:hypothetical protein